MCCGCPTGKPIIKSVKIEAINELLTKEKCPITLDLQPSPSGPHTPRGRGQTPSSSEFVSKCGLRVCVSVMTGGSVSLYQELAMGTGQQRLLERNYLELSQE